MSRSRAMDRVRRVVDDVMIFAALLLLAWPALFDGGARQDGGFMALALPIAVVFFLGFGVVMLTTRWPLLQYAPVASAVFMAAFWRYRHGAVDPALTWMILGVSTIILIRQFLGSRTNEGLMRDLTRQRAILASQAFRDPLTELGNRKMFIDHASDALADADDTMTAVILVDLDGFKEINDTYGHATGDQLLRATAERLNANVRANDTVSRLGGDEFVILCPAADVDRLGERIRAMVREPIPVAGEQVKVGISVGVALAQPGSTADDLISRADAAMYAAKQSKAVGALSLAMA
jgi:diguanylate cyclase (GGDEF)-like protein